MDSILIIASLIIYNIFYLISVKEASDACLWLKAAGFPQYVQMFEGECIESIISQRYLILKHVSSLVLAEFRNILAN